ncbi:MAG: hypothetical protein LBQ57_03090, partial [Spirochaetales bacterium]|nr:hypothetical protein [Spirochaetales bacterium]
HNHYGNCCAIAFQPEALWSGQEARWRPLPHISGGNFSRRCGKDAFTEMCGRDITTTARARRGRYFQVICFIVDSALVTFTAISGAEMRFAYANRISAT